MHGAGGGAARGGGARVPASQRCPRPTLGPLAPCTHQGAVGARKSTRTSMHGGCEAGGSLPSSVLERLGRPPAASASASPPRAAGASAASASAGGAGSCAWARQCLMTSMASASDRLACCKGAGRGPSPAEVTLHQVPRLAGGLRRRASPQTTPWAPSKRLHTPRPLTRQCRRTWSMPMQARHASSSESRELRRPRGTVGLGSIALPTSTAPCGPAMHCAAAMRRWIHVPPLSPSLPPHGPPPPAFPIAQQTHLQTRAMNKGAEGRNAWSRSRSVAWGALDKRARNFASVMSSA